MKDMNFINCNIAITTNNYYVVNQKKENLIVKILRLLIKKLKELFNR